MCDQPLVEGVGEALLVGGIEGGRAAGLHAGRAQLFHEVAHAEPRLDGLAGIDLAAGVECLATGIDHPGGERYVASDHQIPRRDLLGDDMIRHIESLLHLLGLDEGGGGHAQSLIGH